jgi:hypothetical protein
MPKTSSYNVLRRWRAMDRALAGDGLKVWDFADVWEVSAKTVWRDLTAFRQLGQRTARTFAKHQVLYIRYDRGVKPLFTANLQPL